MPDIQRRKIAGDIEQFLWWLFVPFRAQQKVYRSSDRNARKRPLILLTTSTWGDYLTCSPT